MKINLAIISPTFPPNVDGLGDYSYLVGTELRMNLDNVFFLCPETENKNFNEKVFLFEKNRASFDELVQRLSITNILLNYSGYGYDNKGIPFWLLSILKFQKSKGVRVFIFFHEISATGPFYKPVFWLGAIQKWLFKKLYEIADYSFCSNEIANRIIQDSTRDKGKKCINIGLISNISPTEINKPWAFRSSIAVVFGSPGRRLLVYQQFEKWDNFIKENGIVSIIDIGEPLDFDFEKLKVKIVEKGVLSSSKISQILSDCQFGLLDYPVHLLGKSGVYAAYAAYGIVPVIMDISSNEAAIGKQDQNFIFIDHLNSFKGRPPVLISQDIYTWYFNNNSIKVHSQKILNAIFYHHQSQNN